MNLKGWKVNQSQSPGRIPDSRYKKSCIWSHKRIFYPNKTTFGSELCASNRHALAAEAHSDYALPSLYTKHTHTHRLEYASRLFNIQQTFTQCSEGVARSTSYIPDRLNMDREENEQSRHMLWLNLHTCAKARARFTYKSRSLLSDQLIPTWTFIVDVFLS